MTEYDYSPEAYERYLATQHRIANWVDKTEQHRAEFQSAVASGPQDLSRSGPASHSRRERSSPSPPRPKHSGQSQPRQLVIYPPPSESSDSSDSYYEGPWPASRPRQSPPMLLHQQPAFHTMQLPLSSPPPMMIPSKLMTSSHRLSHHHRHRLHDQRRSRSQHSPAYYNLASPPLSPGYQYPYPTVMNGAHQGYVMMPQYGMPVMSNSSQPPLSAPANVTSFSVPTAQPTNYFQPQLQSSTAFSNSQPCSPQQGMAWSTYAAPSPVHPTMSTPAGTPLQSPPHVVGVAAYQPFAVQQPTQQPSYLVPPAAYQRVYDLSKFGSSKQYSRRSVG